MNTLLFSLFNKDFNIFLKNTIKLFKDLLKNN